MTQPRTTPHQIAMRLQHNRARHAANSKTANPSTANQCVRHAVLRVCAVLGVALSCLAPTANAWTGADPSPVATSAPASTDRILRKHAIVDAPLEDVWHAWTTEEGITAFWGVESNIDLRIGGPYELYMGMKKPDASGKRGSEGCKILSFIPREMLSFEWNFSTRVPSLRNSGALTHVVLRFKSLGKNRTRVDFAQLGWKEGKDWDKGYEYFDMAWSWVFGRLKERAAVLAKAKPTPDAPAEKTWTDGHVQVTAIKGAEKRQAFELTLPASVADVWRVLATSEGMAEVLGIANTRIELAPGGAYTTWPGAPNRVMSYVPHEMLATTGSAPPKFPNVRKGGTWSAYFLEPLGKDTTKLRLCVVGWRSGEKEWDAAYDYFLKANATYLSHLHEKLTKHQTTAKTKAAESD